MENHDLYPMTILKVKQIHNCKKCFKKLQKKMLEINGVIAASIDEENKLVSVRGKADPWVLIKAIEENGNTAELLSYEKKPKKNTYSESTTSESEKNSWAKKSYGFWKGKDKKNSSKNKKEKEEHKIEDYEPQKIDPEVCRDPFCKLHKRRPTITSRVPSRDSENHPHHTGMGIFPGVHHLFHQTNPFRHYDYPPDMDAPPAYNGGPVPNRFTFYGNGNPRNPGNCTMM